MKKSFITHFFLLVILFPSFGQDGKGIIEGRIFNSTNNEPIPFANIVIWGTTIGSTSDLDGNFLFTGIAPGYVELRASAIGFETYISEQILVTNANKVFLEIPMVEKAEKLDEVVIKVSPFRRTDESPVSLQRLGVAEIEKNPGGNRDISRVVQTLPGVASSVSFRNDLIVRGGGANENKFYLDGIEIPNLNHFSTQGASGGPVGIINVDLIREVNFYTGAYPASIGNSLSSVMELKQKNGNKDKLKFRGSVGATDMALAVDGPIGENVDYIFSVRRSYLQFLFDVLELPFLPTYTDYQMKIRARLGEKKELSLISLGALDQFQLNLDANETELQRYYLDNLPVNPQWNYAIGAVYKQFHDNSNDVFVVSRNYLNNRIYKYQGNVEVDSLKTIDISSAEIENKFRYERNIRTTNNIKINIGINLEYAKYTNDAFNKTFLNGDVISNDYNTYEEFYKWGVFGQASKKVMDERLGLSIGLRADGNNYNEQMANPLNQLSPRLSASYNLLTDLYLNFNTGIYYQVPAYTTLGYKDPSGQLVNKENDISYIRADHLVGGVEYLPDENSKVTLEGFFKYYTNYPFSVQDSVAISSKSAGFGIFGNEEVTSTGVGRAYGLELLYRNKDLFGINLILSYTLVNSEFKDIDGDYIPTAWDNNHLLNVVATRRFKKNWEVGFKWRFVGGAPYTPYDEFTSSIPEAWNLRGEAYLDYSRFNEKRLDPFHQLDVRVDKEFYFDKFSLIAYLDIQNIYNFRADARDILLVDTDDSGEPIILPNGRYQLKRLTSEDQGSGNILPSVGIIVEF